MILGMKQKRFLCTIFRYAHIVNRNERFRLKKSSYENTPFPKPGEQAQLVRHGIYAVIRHPLYTSVIAAAMGWALVWQRWPALLVSVVLIPFFHAKTRREERWLREQFPEYADYERRVRRFVPWLY